MKKLLKTINSYIPKTLEELKYSLILIGLIAGIIAMICGAIFVAYVIFMAYWNLSGL